MEPTVLGALQNKDFWKDMGRNLVNLPETASSTISKFGKIPHEADVIADRLFPNSARDASTKNAFRHALGTGLIAQEMGANKGGLQAEIAKNAAKGMGYVWEMLGAPQYVSDPKYREDTKHDLTANAIGASASMNAANKEELIKALQTMAINSKVQRPVGVFQESPSYLTRTVR